MNKKAIDLIVLLILVGMLLWGCGQSQSVSNVGAEYVGISVSPEAATLSVGSTQQFTIGGLIKSSSVDIDNVSWIVIGGVGTIDAQGFFTATAEGESTIEAWVDSMIGRAKVTVSEKDGKVLSGTVFDMFSSNNSPIPSASVMMGGAISKTNSSGFYKLEGISLEAKRITASAPGHIPSTLVVSITAEAVNVPLGFSPTYNVGGIAPVLVKGRIIDGQGNPVSSAQINVVIRGSSHGLYSGLDGTFSANLSVSNLYPLPKGYISVVYQKSSTYYGTIQEFSLSDAATLELGDITAETVTATIELNLSVPDGLTVSSVYWGVQGDDYRFQMDYSNVSGNKAVLHVPISSSGLKYYVCGLSWAGSYYDGGASYKCDLIIDSPGTYNVDLTFSPLFSILSPENKSETDKTPVLEWEGLGEGYVYQILIGSSTWLKWFVLTKETSFEVPLFPTGSDAESCNLQEGGTYFWKVYAFHYPSGLNLEDLNLEKYSRYDAYVTMGSRAFIVNTSSSSGSKALSIDNREKFDNRVKEFLKGIGFSFEEVEIR